MFRDLKPENILFDGEGHVKVADFGLSKEGVTESTDGAHSFCGTPEYLAPEILDRKGHGTAVDYWNLGMVTYEMLTGLPPWYTKNRQKLFDRLRNAPLQFPSHVSSDARSLLRGLLCRDPSRRLNAAQIKASGPRPRSAHERGAAPPTRAPRWRPRAPVGARVLPVGARVLLAR